MSNDLTVKGMTNFDEYSQYAGEGFETVDTSDLKIPIIGVLQTNSPQCNSRTGIPDAKAGDFYIDVNQTLISGEEGFEFIIADVRHVFVEWKPRESGGGLVDVYPAGSDKFMWASKNNKIGEKLLHPKSGNVIVETYYMHILMMQNGDPIGQFLLPLSSTKIDAYRRLMTQVSMFLHGKKSIPRYAFVFKATTVPRKNAKGEFYGIQFTPANTDLANSLLAPTSELFTLARDTHKSASGVNLAQITASQNAAGNNEIDDDMPF